MSVLIKTDPGSSRRKLEDLRPKPLQVAYPTLEIDKCQCLWLTSQVLLGRFIQDMLPRLPAPGRYGVSGHQEGMYSVLFGPSPGWLGQAGRKTLFFLMREILEASLKENP